MALKRISGLWLKQNDNGQFMAGDTREPIPAGSKLLVFRNRKKVADQDPDYHLVLATDERPEQSEPTDTANNPSRQPAATATDETIPF